MAEFKITNIVNGNTIETKPTWVWKNRDGIELKGNLIVISGLQLSPNNSKLLESLLLNQYVTIVNPKQIEDRIDVIECNVLLNNVDVVKYF